MHYALIQNNTVVHVLRVPPINIYPAQVADQYTPCGEDVQPGWLVADGVFSAPPPPPETAPEVPTVVTMRQARLALLGAGLLAGVDAAIAALPSPQKEAALIEWEYSSEVHRNRAFVQSLAGALSLTEQQLDALFLQAGAL